MSPVRPQLHLPTSCGFYGNGIEISGNRRTIISHSSRLLELVRWHPDLFVSDRPRGQITDCPYHSVQHLTGLAPNAG